MAGNTFGKLFRVTTAGVSHGSGYLCIIDGCPAGLELSVEDLLPDLRRRRPGQSKLTTQRDEADAPEIWSGVFEGKTDGTPIGLLFRNGDQRSGDYGDIKDKYRPGHADFTFDAKYGFRDYRGGGRRSARETVCRVAAGAVAKKLLAREGISVLGYVKQVGDVVADVPDPTAVTLEQVEATPVRCPLPEPAAAMIELIDAVRKDRDSIGGVCELVATGVPPGLGEPVFDKLKADLGKALLSLPAVLGFEYGAGFAVANMRGSENNDVFTPDPWRARTSRRSPRTRRTATPRCGSRSTPRVARPHRVEPARRDAWRYLQRYADRLPRRDQADQQHPAGAAHRDAHRRADGDSGEGPARPVSVAAIRADGRSDDGPGAGGSPLAESRSSRLS